MFGTIMTVRRGIRQNVVQSVLFFSARENGISTRFHEKLIKVTHFKQFVIND